MTQSELKKKLYGLVSVYFALLHERGNIVWGKTSAVKPGANMITLTLSDVNRYYRPARRYINGIPHDSYPTSTTLNIDLFTKGASTTSEENVTAQNENTAVNDLTDFANFLNSVYVDHWCGRNGVSLRVRAVQDLTALTHGSSWQYRALLEVGVDFVQSAGGYAAINYEGSVPLHDNGTPKYDGEGYALDEEGNALPDPPLPTDPESGKPIYPAAEITTTGGRSQQLADDFTGYFEEVEGPTDTDMPSGVMPPVENMETKLKKEVPRHG